MGKFIRLKTPLKSPLLVFGVAGAVFFSAVILFFTFDLPAHGFFAKSQLYNRTNLTLPARLKIPKINIDAAVEEVGLTPAGAMGVPKGPDGAAWYNLGPRPGEIGSAVIDGHSGYKNNRAAIFDNLYKLQKGDKIYVKDQLGTTTTFIVREIVSFGNNEAVPGIFDSSDGLSHLNLITCTGVWDNTAKTHSKRLVVYADKSV